MIFYHLSLISQSLRLKGIPRLPSVARNDTHYMCGIVGYIGNKQAAPILLQGLRRLEYRGYDSAGIAVLSPNHPTTQPPNHKIERVRAVWKIDVLAEKLKGIELIGTVGIGHTRWATHGGVSEANAHPHFAADGKLALVHNGIIENYRELREVLGKTHQFESETDSEILAHLISSHYHGDLRQAVEAALSHVRGTYGIVIMHADHPDQLIAARFGSPLVVGIGEPPGGGGAAPQSFIAS